MSDEKKRIKPSAPIEAKNITELLFTDFEHNDLSANSLLPHLSPIELVQAARTSQFFRAGAKADSDSDARGRALGDARWEALVREKFAAHPVRQKKSDEKSGQKRLETYKEMYQRLNALYVEIRKELMSPQPNEHKAIVKAQEKRLELFAKIVKNGFDKFADYFPHLLPEDINREINDKSGLRDESFLRIAAVNGQTEFVRRILEWGGRVDARAPGYIDSGGGFGMWFPRLGNDALIFAAAHGHLDCIRLLIENPDEANRADINRATPDYGTTALHAAAEGGHADCVKYLLDHGARTDIADTHHKNIPFEVAENDACRELIRHKMLERGEPVPEGSSCAIS